LEEEKAMYCSRCGTTLLEGTTFCTSCGAPVSNLAANAPGAGAVAAPGSMPVVAPGAGYPPAGYAAPGAVPMAWAPPVPYAGFWLRAVAYLIDCLIMGIVAVPIIIVLAVLTGASATIHGLSEDNAEQALAGASVAMFLFVMFVVLLGGIWLYYALTESSAWQGTVGKKMLGLIVTDMDGRRVTFGRATGRYFSRIVTGLVPLMFGYILAGITAKKQALHDLIASTLVLRKTS
jgi:uncharacterized RDD family membrane protein YckC